VLNKISFVKFILDIDTVLCSERDEMVVIHNGVFYHVLTWWIHSMMYVAAAALSYTPATANNLSVTRVPSFAIFPLYNLSQIEHYH